jgi:RNA polymerase sigma-70 factor, ECF subfamily
MEEHAWLAARFEEHRTYLRAVGYRMLGSLAEADEAVQDSWLRVSRSGADGVENLRGWLTTIVTRVCLNILRARKARHQNSLDVHLPDPIVSPDGKLNPEQEALLAESVGLALQVVLDTLSPAERIAFVLHDMFEVPFDEIAPMLGRSSTAARQLASRARHRVKGASIPVPDADVACQRQVVDAFFAAARNGDLDALVAVLDPQVVLRSDGGKQRRAASFVRSGAADAARTALMFALPSATLRPALINGTAGVIVINKGVPFAVMGFTVAQGKIAAIHAVLGPERLARMDLGVLTDHS